MRRLPFILILLPCLLHAQSNVIWTNIPLGNLTLPLTAEALASTNGATPVRRVPLSLFPFDAAGAATAATNGLGTAASKNIGFFDLAGAATAATNSLLSNSNAYQGSFTGNGGGLSNVTASTMAASNVFSGGVLPLGTVSSGVTGFGGPMLTSNSVARFWTWNGGALTNLNGSQVTGPVPLAANVTAASLTNKVWATNVSSGGQLPLGTVSGGLDSSIAGPMLTTNGVGRFYSYNAGALTNLNQGEVSNAVSGIFLPLTGGTLSGPVFTTDSSTTNSPANNQLPSAGWVRNLFNTGADYFLSTNIVQGTNAAQAGQPMYGYQSTIPLPAVRSYATTDFLTNGGYIGSARTTNSFLSFGGQVVIDSYLAYMNGGGSPTLSIHAEIYLSYDLTNWFGDYASQSTPIANGTTNLYQWLITVPTTTSTNSGGLYVSRRYKVDSITGTGGRTLYLLIGTNLLSGVNSASHITMQSPNATAGNAFLPATQTFSGSNTFTGGFYSSTGANTLYPTNTGGTAPTFSFTTAVTYSDLTTNAAFTFLAPVNVSTTNYQTAVVLVTNSTAAAVVVTPPANCHTQGTWYLTNVSVFSFFSNHGAWTNAIALPLF